MIDTKPLLALTLGDPSGIGPEVVVKALANPEINDTARMFVVGTECAVRQALAETNIDLAVERIHDPLHTPDSPDVVPVLSVGEYENVEFPQGRHSVDRVEHRTYGLRNRRRCVSRAKSMPWLRRQSTKSRGKCRVPQISDIKMSSNG